MTIDGNEYLIAPAGAGTLRDLRADELESVAGGCCCGMPGCDSRDSAVQKYTPIWSPC